MKIHIVRSGDSLDTLAEKYQLSVDQIMEANPSIKKDQLLEQGSKIFIPSGKIPLTREEEESDQSVESFHSADESNQQQESSSAVEREELSESPYYPTPPETYVSEYIPSPSYMPPLPPMPSAFCPYSYPSPPVNPYFHMGYLSAFPYYPYAPYGQPYGQVYGGDPYYSDSFTYESSSDYHEFHDPTWERNWTVKESSSVEG